jgi:glycosyltransferase involved in cell wall biosynthesis
MHVLLITSYFPSRRAPVTGIFFQDQAAALHRAGHKVGVLVAPRINITLEEVQRGGLASLRAVTRDDTFADYPVYRMHWGWFPRVVPPVVALLTGPAGLRAYEAYCQEQGEPDVIHGHNTFYGGYVAARIGQRFGKATVLTEHSSSFLKGLVILPGQGRIVRETLRQVDARLIVGQALAGPLQRYTPEQSIEVIGNIVDTDVVGLAPPPPDPPPFTFFVVAQLKQRLKNFDVLLRAFRKAFADRPGVALHIGGDGPLRPELEQLTATLGLPPQVRFLGRLTREEVRDLIARSHALVSASSIETFGLSIAEALACGRPAVVTRSGGPEGFVTDRSGILVPPKDVDALAAAMQRMVGEYGRFDPATVREDCVSRFSVKAYVARLEAVYQQALARHR